LETHGRERGYLVDRRMKVENRQATKNITVGDKTFQITKMDPRTSCWLFSVMGSKAEGKMILTAFGNCSKEEFDQIQSLALRQILWLDNKDGTVFPTSLIAQNGKFTISIEADELYQLTSESVIFSLSPFLVEQESSLQK